MKINNDKGVTIVKSYLITVILFIFLGFLFKTIETFSFSKMQDAVFLTILQSFFNITAIFCLYSLIILPFYLLLRLLGNNIVQIFISVLFALLISLEIGLYIYYTQAGVLMGRELVIRPISEILTTIRNSSNLLVNSILLIIIFAYFITLPFVLKRVKIFNHYLSLIIGIGIIGILSACTFFYQKGENQITNNYLESKSFFFFSSLRTPPVDEMEPEYLFFDETGNFGMIEKNKKILKEYIALYNKMAEDMDYPMERIPSDFPDVLAPFFNKYEKQPNIVIIMVESLGTPFLGKKGKNLSFTPFLDSLASVGLFWKNCLSTTSRTYGVVPSVTGSVPHGMKGFQFGIMPKHLSLFTILKNNNYKTSFFYGGDTNFDSMLDYLTAQEIDHIENHLPQLRSLKKKNKANWWGVHDDVLFAQSLEYIKKLPNDKQKLNVYLTLTTHDPFNSREDKKLKEIYEPKAEKVFLTLNEEQKKFFQPIKGNLPGFMYVDDCIKNFIHNYSKQPDFENTIFIITGDHSYGTHEYNLHEHSVPLIIWSPLLKTHKIFPNIVSHLAIVPSVVSFLQHNYNIDVPNKLSWCSTGLDTASVFNPSEKVLFLSYERIVKKMVYNQYFFEDQTKWYEKRAFEMDENLDLKKIEDPKLVEQIYSKFKTLKYVNNYVYHNNKLINTDNHFDEEYRIIKGYENTNTLVCTTPDTIPSISGVSEFEIMPVKKIKGKYNKIKIRLKTDIVINDFVYQDQEMKLNIVCSGEQFKYDFSDHITKYILDDEILIGKKYELFIEKEIDVRGLEESSVHIYISTNEYDANWEPNKKITISNIKVIILAK